MPQVVHSPSLWMQRLERWSEPCLVALLLLAAIALFTFNLGNLPLRDWDEGTIAQVAREIWRAEPGTMRWLYPTLGGNPYFNKPPLVHGLIALAYRWGGVNEWTSRLPGALLSAGAVPLLYGIGREIFMQRTPAVMAALIYLTMMPVVRHGRLAMLDGAVVFFFLVVLWCGVRSRRDPRWTLGIGLAIGLIGLTKGMIAILLGAIALGFLLWDAPRLLTSLYLWGGVLLGMVPLVGWYAAQWLEYGPMFLGTHVVDQSISRIWAPVDNNAGPPWFYVLELAKYAWPWLLFVPLGLQTAWRSRTLSWAKLVLVWSGGYFLVISVMGTKLPWYVMPMYPALALAIAVPLSELWQRSSALTDGERPAQSYPRLWLGWLGLMAIAGWGGGLYFGLGQQPTDPGLPLTLMAFGLTMTVAAVLMARGDRQFMVILLWGTYVSLMLFFSTGHWVWELAENYPVKPVAALVQQEVPPNVPVYISDTGRPSLSFYSDRKIHAVPTRDRLLRRWQSRSPRYFLLDATALGQLDLSQAEVLGNAEGWTLVKSQARSRSPRV